MKVKGVNGRYWEDNNKSAKQELAFVQTKVKEYVEKGVVEVCKTPPKFVNPLSVVKKIVYKTGATKKRLVIDVSRHLNPLVEKMPSKPDELSHAEQMFEKGMWAATLDLEGMYHHAFLQEETAELFGFRVPNAKGGSTFYRYKALPFGFKNSGALMARLTKPLIRYIRSLGIYVNLYIDDFLIIDPSQADLAKKIEIVKLVFRLAGWTFEAEKSMKEPAQSVEYLGFIINFKDFTYSISKEKRQHIKEQIRDLLTKNQVEGQVPTRQVAECLGKLASVRKAVGPILAVCLRHSQHELGRAVFTGIIDQPFWGGSVHLDPDCIRELLLAFRALSTISHRRIPPSGEKLIFSLNNTDFSFGFDLKYPDQNFEVFCSDASDKSAFTYEAGSFRIVEDYSFSPFEQNLGSGRRELLAIITTLEKNAQFFKDSKKNIFWLSDSQNVFFWLKRGSRHAEIQKVLLDIKYMEMQLDIELYVVWQPRTVQSMVWADSGSKLHLSTDEWGMSFRDFKRICDKLGYTPTVDAFASRQNAVLPTFFSKCPQLGTAGVDFFAQELRADQVYWCTPPVSIIIKVIRHILDYESPVCAIVNVPEWHSALFWPFLVKNDRFAPFVHRVAFIRPRFTTYNISSRNLFCGKQDFRMIACLIDNRKRNNCLFYR